MPRRALRCVVDLNIQRVSKICQFTTQNFCTISENASCLLLHRIAVIGTKFGTVSMTGGH